MDINEIEQQLQALTTAINNCHIGAKTRESTCSRCFDSIIQISNVAATLDKRLLGWTQDAESYHKRTHSSLDTLLHATQEYHKLSMDKFDQIIKSNESVSIEIRELTSTLREMFKYGFVPAKVLIIQAVVFGIVIVSILGIKISEIQGVLHP